MTYGTFSTLDDVPETRQVTIAKIAELVGEPRSTVANWALDRLAGATPWPPPVDRYGRTDVYDWIDVYAWLKANGRADLVPDEWKPKGRRRS